MSQTSTSATVAPPLNLEKWIENNRDRLRPPVGNQYLYDGKDFFTMIIAGPNARNDFHVTESEEFFYQLRGDMVVQVIESGKKRNIPLRQGETLFIPGLVPHAPHRPPGTIGMVVERRRPPGEREHLQFYCEKCDALVYDLDFDCADIVEHFARAMEEFWVDQTRTTCKECGARVRKPKPVKRIVFEPRVVIEREGA